MMKFEDLPETGNRQAFSGMQKPMATDSEKVPMHPDDFAGLMSWITAKRSHETGPDNHTGVITPFISG